MRVCPGGLVRGIVLICVLYVLICSVRGVIGEFRLHTWSTEMRRSPALICPLSAAGPPSFTRLIDMPKRERERERESARESESESERKRARARARKRERERARARARARARESKSEREQEREREREREKERAREQERARERERASEREVLIVPVLLPHRKNTCTQI